MKFNYIDSSGSLKNFFLNGIFLKFVFNLNFLYQFFIYYVNFYRINNSCQKTRSFVNFSKKKLYKQKGTGRSRVGSASSAIRIKGGRAFSNYFYINYRKKINKKSYNLSYFFIYSNIFINNFFFLIEDIFFIENKTKLFKYYFKFNNNFKNFYLTFKIEKNFFLSSINLNNFFLFYFFNFNPIFLLKMSKLFITRSCIEYFLNDKFL